MAKYYVHKPGDRDEIYDAATKWKNECLLNNRSLIWDGEFIWTKQNMDRFRTVFIDEPDVSGNSFDEKLRNQLKDESEDIYKFVIELLFVYYLFPVESSIKFTTKMEKLAMVAEWKNIDFDQSLPILKALKDGIATTGTFFNTQKYVEISFIFSFVEKMKEKPSEEREAILENHSKLKSITEEARKEVGKRAQSQHIILHLLMPDSFERISSGGDKTKIVKSYADMLSEAKTDDIDERLWIIREKLEEENPNEVIDFYMNPIAAERWRGAVWPFKNDVDNNSSENEGSELTPETGDASSIDFSAEGTLDGLIFENKDLLLSQITTSLQKGKNIIFTGPPGTGKSKLASVVCDIYGVKRKMVTASSNWSTFDTIGGYMPNRDGDLYFSEGIFLNCFKDKATGGPKNEWLIIDEINRADIDKAFGSLFSVLTGDEVMLPFEAANGEPITIVPEDKVNPSEATDNEYVIPNDWRIIGTMNTIDKASLYEMSYAFMRRFAFIPVGIPKSITEEVIEEYLTVWDMEDYPLIPQLTAIWKLINEYRKIGPAIVEDIANYTIDHEDFTSAIILYVLPQFEGLPIQRIHEFIRRFRDETDIIIDFETLKDFVEDFFEAGLFE